MKVSNVEIPNEESDKQSQSKQSKHKTSRVVGNKDSGAYWTVYTDATGEKTYDLTRGPTLPTFRPRTLRNVFSGPKKSAIIEPSRCALVIVDMQNAFLHPHLNPAGDGPRAAVAPTLRMIDAMRSIGAKVCWVNWGLTDADLERMPASFAEPWDNGVDLGKFIDEDGREIVVGRQMMKDQCAHICGSIARVFLTVL